MQYDSTAPKTFIRGLSSNMHSILCLRNSDTLELTMSYVTKEENFCFLLKISLARWIRMIPHLSKNFIIN